MGLPEPYYEADGVTLYHGDCLEIMGPLSLSGDVVCITDPPYEAEAHTKGRRVSATDGLRSEQINFDPITKDQCQRAGAAISRLTTRWALTFCQVEASVKWSEVYVSAGMEYVRTCIWVKPDGMPQYTGDRPGMGYESIVLVHPKGKKRWNGGGRHGVFVFPKNSGGKHLHQTQKPLPLMSILVRLFADSDDLILDPFTGSGSTLIAAISHGRPCIGIEQHEPYCEIAAKRLEAASRGLSVNDLSAGQRSIFDVIGRE